MSRGCDYSWERPSLQGLKNSGIQFACRYLSYDTSGKNLSRSEANALHAMGIATVSNWEAMPDASLQGINEGIKHARAALLQHAQYGGPQDRPIYFSIDFDAQQGDLFAVQSYIQGCVMVLGHDRVGAYGGLRVMEHLRAINACRWFWQTSAWSRGIWSLGVNIRQYAYNVHIGGDVVDLDQGMTDDVGQWGTGALVTTPQPGGHESWDFTQVIDNISARLTTMGNQMSSMATSIRAARK